MVLKRHFYDILKLMLYYPSKGGKMNEKQRLTQMAVKSG